jgi:hypothetical protein
MEHSCFEKLTVSQLAKQFSAFYGTQRLVFVSFTTVLSTPPPPPPSIDSDPEPEKILFTPTLPINITLPPTSRIQLSQSKSYANFFWPRYVLNDLPLLSSSRLTFRIFASSHSGILVNKLRQACGKSSIVMSR